MPNVELMRLNFRAVRRNAPRRLVPSKSYYDPVLLSALNQTAE